MKILDFQVLLNVMNNCCLLQAIIIEVFIDYSEYCKICIVGFVKKNTIINAFKKVYLNYYLNLKQKDRLEINVIVLNWYYNFNLSIKMREISIYW